MRFVVIVKALENAGDLIIGLYCVHLEVGCVRAAWEYIRLRVDQNLILFKKNICYSSKKYHTSKKIKQIGLLYKNQQQVNSF